MKKHGGKQLSFRPMTLTDIPQIMALEKRTYTAPWPESLYQSELRNPHAFYTLAMQNNKLVGYAGMRLYPNRQGHLMTMVVDSNYRGHGFGEELLAHKINRVREKGATSIFLEVRVSNTVAQNLYRKFGFVQTGMKHGYYPDNMEAAFVLTLDLSVHAQTCWTNFCCHPSHIPSMTGSIQGIMSLRRQNVGAYHYLS